MRTKLSLLSLAVILASGCNPSPDRSGSGGDEHRSRLQATMNPDGTCTSGLLRDWSEIESSSRQRRIFENCQKFTSTYANQVSCMAVSTFRNGPWQNGGYRPQSQQNGNGRGAGRQNNVETAEIFDYCAGVLAQQGGPGPSIEERCSSDFEHRFNDVMDRPDRRSCGEMRRIYPADYACIGGRNSNQRFHMSAVWRACRRGR